MIQQTLDKLYQMKLGGMADFVREQIANPTAASLSFEERLSLAVDRQWDLKENRALARRLSIARLKQQAAVEDIDFRESLSDTMLPCLSSSEKEELLRIVRGASDKQ